MSLQQIMSKQVKLETIIPAKAIRSNNDGKFKSQDSDAFLTSKETSRQLATLHILQQMEQQSVRIKILWILHALCTRASHTCAYYKIKTPNNAMHYARIRHRCQGLSPIKLVNKHDNHML
ncbi:hypothetical protein BASA60_001573 [Batrachochytrium salamandrivorans]|nr:hypothetical protein BASA60_001573 [Batrachochytrium salamandrivorans]